MNRWLAILLTGAATVTAVMAFACGGDDKKVTLGNGDEVTVSDDLPEDFPDDFPIYDGADLQGSAQGEASGINGFVVTWKTGDDLDDVKTFYDEELADGSWTSTSSGEQGGNSAFWLVENEDKSKAAYVTTTTDGSDTIILVTIGDQDDASSGSDEEATSDDADSGSGGDTPSGGDSAELLDEVDLSDDFPKDRVPFPDDARVTSSSSFSGGGTKTYLVELNSKDDVGTLVDFFTSELEGNGWTESFTTESNGEAFLTFAPAEGADASADAATIAISPSDVDGYSDVVISVSVGE